MTCPQPRAELLSVQRHPEPVPSPRRAHSALRDAPSLLPTIRPSRVRLSPSLMPFLCFLMRCRPSAGAPVIHMCTESVHKAPVGPAALVPALRVASFQLEGDAQVLLRTLGQLGDTVLLPPSYPGQRRGAGPTLCTGPMLTPGPGGCCVTRANGKNKCLCLQMFWKDSPRFSRESESQLHRLPAGCPGRVI